MTKEKKAKKLPKKHKGNELSHKEYAKTLAELKEKIREGQLNTTSSVNKELIRLYEKIQ